jgi:hypothetical protein
MNDNNRKFIPDFKAIGIDYYVMHFSAGSPTMIYDAVL